MKRAYGMLGTINAYTSYRIRALLRMCCVYEKVQVLFQWFSSRCVFFVTFSPIVCAPVSHFVIVIILSHFLSANEEMLQKAKTNLVHTESMTLLDNRLWGNVCRCFIVSAYCNVYHTDRAHASILFLFERISNALYCARHNHFVSIQTIDSFPYLKHFAPSIPHTI